MLCVFDPTGEWSGRPQVAASDGMPLTRARDAEPEAHDAHQAGLARHQLPVIDMHSSGVNA